MMTRQDLLDLLKALEANAREIHQKVEAAYQLLKLFPESKSDVVQPVVKRGRPSKQPEEAPVDTPKLLKAEEPVPKAERDTRYQYSSSTGELLLKKNGEPRLRPTFTKAQKKVMAQRASIMHQNYLKSKASSRS